MILGFGRPSVGCLAYGAVHVLVSVHRFFMLCSPDQTIRCHIPCFEFGCFIFELHLTDWRVSISLVVWNMAFVFLFRSQVSALFIYYLFLSYIYGLFNDVASSSDASYSVDSVVTAVALASPLHEYGAIKKTAWEATLKYIYLNSIAQIIEISLTSVPLHDSHREESCGNKTSWIISFLQLS